MNTNEVAVTRTPRTLGTARFIKRAFILAIAVTAMATALHPAVTSAAVSEGSGSADELVYCNSVNHTVTVTTWSTGIPGNLVQTSYLENHYASYNVWLRVQEYVNGAWVPTIWKLVPDGTHSFVVSTPARQTSYWYFQWAFETPYGTQYHSEYAGGHAPYGWYSDQRGYRSLGSCWT